jgi:hypothetical protein
MLDITNNQHSHIHTDIKVPPQGMNCVTVKVEDIFYEELPTAPQKGNVLNILTYQRCHFISRNISTSNITSENTNT